MGEWSQLEYVAISDETAASNGQFYLTSCPRTLLDNFPPALAGVVDSGKLKPMGDEVSELPGLKKEQVCLLDPSATTELCPEDGDVFQWYVFGGILGTFHSIKWSLKHQANGVLNR